MEIKDLFSHKIHSSKSNWPNRLIDIASIFSEFDGKPYDRSAIEARFLQISPRSSMVARDPSKFRDEITAYPAYLGLYRVELIDNVWHMFLSNTAKQFLVCEEPNVPAFMLLQITLFQYPNGMGISYEGNSRLQANAKDRTLNFISRGIHLSPFRLICKGLKAKSIIEEIDPLKASLSFDEVFVLANQRDTNSSPNPDIDNVIETLLEAEYGNLAPPLEYENRFHILRHTDFLKASRKDISIRDAINRIDEQELLRKFDTILAIDNTFTAFDAIENKEELLDQIRSCSWGKYFDGVKTLDSNIVKILTNENLDIYSELERSEDSETTEFQIVKSNHIYNLKPVNLSGSLNNTVQSKNVHADPEVTKIRRQRANLIHKIVLEKLYNYLENLGATPLENEHIDLFAEIPSRGKFIFEVKSINQNNLLSQSRKGLSQLYEYRYRYQNIIGYDVNLFLVYPQEPVVIPWLQEYLCQDRNIGIIWFDAEDQLQFSSYCEAMVRALV